MTGQRRTSRLPCLFVAACLALTACTARERFSPESDSDTESTLDTGRDGRSHVAVFDLSQGAPEEAPGGLFQLPLERTYPGLVRGLRKALDDDDA